MSQSKPKLLYVITKSAPWGGAQKYVYDLATNATSSYEVVVAVGGDGPLVERLTSEGIRTVPIKALERDISLLKELKVLFELVQIFRRERPHVVHVNSSKAGGLGVVAARCVGVSRIVFTAHGWAFTEPRGRLSRLLIAFFSWLTVLFSHSTITVSLYHRTKARWMPFVWKKLVPIYNGIDAPAFLEKTNARHDLAGRAGIPQGLWQRKVWNGTISELHRNKGLLYLIYAIDALREIHPNVVTVIIGEGEEREGLEETIDRLRLREHVFLTGHVRNAAQYLKAFDIFTLTSVKEGFPYTILEAGTGGIPVVASEIDGIPEMITDRESGILVKAKRPQDIAQALAYLIEHPSQRAVFGSVLKERVTQDFSRDAMVEKTLEIYTK